MEANIRTLSVIQYTEKANKTRITSVCNTDTFEPASQIIGGEPK